MAANFLPDSRARFARGVVLGPSGNMVPIFCANCGRSRGLVREDQVACNFAFALCEPCADKYGDDAHFWREPDSVFWERVRAEQARGRLTTRLDFQRALCDPGSGLSKIKRDYERRR